MSFPFTIIEDADIPRGTILLGITYLTPWEDRIEDLRCK